MIFSIMVLAVLSSLAVPKFMEMLSDAKVSTIKQDVNTIISSIRNYYLIKGRSGTIGDIVSLNSSVWTIEDTKVTYKEDEKISNESLARPFKQIEEQVKDLNKR